jgi:glycosyltransferase involved in cell wall biosynthesis
MNIEYVGQYGTSGYAVAAKGNILYLSEQGHNVSFSPLVFDNSQIDKDSEIDKKVCSKIKSLDYYDMQIFHTLPNLWSLIAERTKKPFPVKQVGYCTWENSKIPNHWIYDINKMSELWVPSSFNKTAFESCGVTIPITVFPHVFMNQTLPDRSTVNLRDYTGKPIPNNIFTYYSIAEYTDRKGINDLIECFDAVNTKNPNTQLVLKLHHKDYSVQNKGHIIAQLSKRTKNLSKSIYVITDNSSNKDILSIHSIGDCYVSLHKGEGFGLSLYDAMNYDKKIVSTNYGGPTDYLVGKQNVSLIDYHLVDEWAYPDLGSSINAMNKFISG